PPTPQRPPSSRLRRRPTRELVARVALRFRVLPATFCLLPFFFTHPAPTQIYTLSLHDALPISVDQRGHRAAEQVPHGDLVQPRLDRKSTRLNSSHLGISYAVFCLKKKSHQSDLLSALRAAPSPCRW